MFVSVLSHDLDFQLHMSYSGAALAPKMLVPEKSPGIKFCHQFQKVGARKFRCHNLFVQNYSLLSMQILSLNDASFEVMILLFYYWLHVKRVNCYVYYDLFCYTGCCVYFGAIFTLKMKQKLCLRTTTGSLPTACKQRMILLRIVTYHDWLENILIPDDIYYFMAY
jgi:hypothetical protein